MMKRIKSMEVKQGAGIYLRRTNPEVEQQYPCLATQCRRVFSTEHACIQHSRDKHKEMTEEKKEKGKKVPKLNIQKVYTGEIGRVVGCPLQLCSRKLFDKHGAAKHAVDKHRYGAVLRQYVKTCKPV